jgi:hypothetical protein
MSLYNALFGVNKAAPLLLAMLGTKPDDVPRFRDCFLQDGQIVIHTRTGGGNRDSYENPERRRESYPDIYDTEEAVQQGPFNEDLRQLPGYVSDEDDDFDSTYANFYYAIPEQFKHLLDKIPEGEDPAKRWQDTFAKLEDGDLNDPVVKRCMAVMEPIVTEIKDTLDNGKGGIVSI